VKSTAPLAPEPTPDALRCRLPRTVRYLVRPSYRRLWGALCRLSPAAAGVLADRGAKPGTPLLLDLPGAEGGRGRLARVESAEPWGQGRYLLRCRFDRPLSHPGLALILEALGAAGPPVG
jgi:hypothetical protein